MDPNFLARLKQTAATGVAPPRESREGAGPMQPIHEQLLASLEERTHPSPMYVPIEGVRTGTEEGTPGRQPDRPGLQSADQAAHYDNESAFKRARTRFDAPARAARASHRKGTIEEVLGEEAVPEVPRSPVDGTPLGPIADVPVAASRDERASDGEAAAKPAKCPICEGTGFLTFGAVTRHCGRCGGEGFVEDPQARVSSTERLKQYPTAVELEDGTTLIAESKAEQRDLQQQVDMAPDRRAQQQVEAALAREVEAALPFAEAVAPEEVSDVVEPAVDVDELGRGDPPALGDAGDGGVGGTEHTPTQGLTYDLPIVVDDLPPFCFVCGPAGTGKTFWAKALAAGDDGVTLAATTGIAAVNLGEGTTINALLRFYDTQSLTDAFTGGWLEAQLKKQRAAGLRRIVLDETSMLSGDQLTILTRALDNVNQDRGGDDAEMGLILIGDFAQLPPVKEPFAFESAEWPRYQAATYGLTTIRRQADVAFIEALQAVRRGDVSQALEFFGPRLEQTTHPQFDGTTVFAKNDAVDKYNQLRLDKVQGAPVEFPSSRWGKLRSEWGGAPMPPFKWGVPEVLRLKIGALVMVLANRNMAERGMPPEYAYVNGDLGTLVDVQKGTALVTLQRTGEPVTVVPIQRENTIPLEVGRRKALNAEGHPERIHPNGKLEIIGACTYMPLRLAWGTTVHKSQGLSLTTVQLSTRDHFWTQPSMMYVGLSRCRTAEGLRIVGNVDGLRARINVDARVKPWL